jgi:hypothetical protein
VDILSHFFLISWYFLTQQRTLDWPARLARMQRRRASALSGTCDHLDQGHTKDTSTKDIYTTMAAWADQTVACHDGKQKRRTPAAVSLSCIESSRAVDVPELSSPGAAVTGRVVITWCRSHWQLKSGTWVAPFADGSVS